MLLFARFATALLAVLFLAQPAAAKVRIASLQNDLHHLPLWVAMDKGLFAKAGVEVESAGVFHAGPELMTAMKAGSLDAGYVGEAPATIAFARGLDRVHMIAQVNTGGSALVVALSSTARTVADLKGGRIAVPGNGTVQDFLVRKSLRDAGLKASDVKIVTIAPSEMAPALQRGQIDAFIAWQPFPARAVVGKLGRVLADSGDIWAGHPCCCIVATEACIESGEAARLAAAHREAVEFIKANPEEAIAVAVKRTGMQEATVREAFARVAYAHVPSVSQEQEYVEFLNAFGLVKVPDSKDFTARFIRDLGAGK
ncbi:MAG: ABC transporter substrate-binding protein [Desulfovibrio sp.]|nr:ABC transporter substrate-binding protein [Desulfovibrio sp.]